MLVYLNALTWTHDPELYAAEIREAVRVGLHLQPCHEYPSVVDVSRVDPGSARHALEFKQIMDSTPADLKEWPTNVYSQIAIALKGGELREPGLANLAERLARREGSAIRTTYSDAAAGSNLAGARRRSSRRTSLLRHTAVEKPRPSHRSDRHTNVESGERASHRPSCSVRPSVSSDVTVGSVSPGETDAVLAAQSSGLFARARSKLQLHRTASKLLPTLGRIASLPNLGRSQPSPAIVDTTAATSTATGSAPTIESSL